MTDFSAPSPVLVEEQRWAGILANVLTPDSELLSVSRWIPDSRTYAHGDRVAIIRITGGRAEHGLRRAAAARTALGFETQHIRGDDWEALIVPRTDGVTLESLIPHSALGSRIAVLAKVVPKLGQMHRRGVAHCDLRPDNVIVTPGGDVQLIDFDRAIRTNRLRAVLADWIGLGAPGPAAKPYWKLVLLTLVPRTRSLLLRARALLPSRDRRPAPQDPQLRLLEEAWRLARTSGANAPGQNVAYYAFTVKGWHLAGERPWYQRWEPIRAHVDFTNKRVLELGCNIGLLSSFASLHGASEAHGIDRSEQVVHAARLVARALNSSATFECLDLVGDPDWDRRLAGADIVVAMSLVHWLPSPDRVLRFLALHPEIIYEGHESLATEIERLRQLGFNSIDVISKSERGREVIHARR